MLCLRDLVLSLALISAIVALQWLLGGVTDVSVAMQTAGSQRVWLIVGGVLSLAFGILLLFLPELSLAVFLAWTAIIALVMGVVQIVIAFRLRSLERV